MSRPDSCTCGWFPQTEDEYFDQLREAERRAKQAEAREARALLEVGHEYRDRKAAEAERDELQKALDACHDLIRKALRAPNP